MKTEQQLILAMNDNKNSEYLLEMIGDETLDLISPAHQDQSLLFYTLKSNHWKFLFELMASKRLRTDNLGCLTLPLATIQQVFNQEKMTPSQPTTASTSSGSEARFDKAIWRYGIFPALPLQAQGQLARINRQFNRLCPEINELRREFPQQFAALLASGQPVNALALLNKARTLAYPQEPHDFDLAPLFRAIAFEDLPGLMSAVSDPVFSTSSDWLTISRKNDILSASDFAFQQDNLAILIYLFSLHPNLKLLETACRHGTKSLIQLMLMADPSHQLIDIMQCFAYSCSQGHTEIVKLLAPFIPVETFTEFLDLAIRIPKAQEMVAVFLQHGAKVRLETVKCYGVELTSHLVYAQTNKLPELFQLLLNHCSPEEGASFTPLAQLVN